MFFLVPLSIFFVMQLYFRLLPLLNDQLLVKYSHYLGSKGKLYNFYSRKLSYTTVTNGHTVKQICTITSESVNASSEFEILILRSKFCVAAWKDTLKAYIDEMEPLCLLNLASQTLEIVKSLRHTMTAINITLIK